MEYRPSDGNLGEYVDSDYSTNRYGYGVNPGSRGGVIASGVTWSSIGSGSSSWFLGLGPGFISSRTKFTIFVAEAAAD